MLTSMSSRLAMFQMKLMLAMILNECEVTLDETQDQREMEGLQMAVLAPKGGRCLLRFKPLKEKSEC
jgi:hypothetical protein